MIKRERIEITRQAMCNRNHVRYLIDRFALGLERFSFTELKGGDDNFNILICDGEGRGVAVARHYLVTAPDEVSSELDFVGFLAERGFPTPPPLRTKEGSAQLLSNDDLKIAVFPFVPGHHIESWGEAQLFTGGSMLAWMHQLCAHENYRVGRTLKRERILREGMETVAASALKDVKPFLDEVRRFLEVDLPRGIEALADLPFGPVHHDMNTGNVIWQGERFAALIDFDEAQDAPLVMDLVMAFQYLALDDDNLLVLDACRALAKGYRSRRELQAEELRALQFCWDYSNIVSAMEFITDNIDYFDTAMECRSFSELYLHNRERLLPLADC